MSLSNTPFWKSLGVRLKAWGGTVAQAPGSPSRRPSSLSALAFATAVMGVLSAGSASALTINLTYDGNESPSFDPDGQKLMAIARAAADRWEAVIEDQSWIHFDISWDNLDGVAMGQYTPSYGPFDSIDIALTTKAFGQDVDWFFDPTPLLDEEFEPVQQTLVRDLTAQDVDNAYNGAVPGVLEAGAFTFARSGTAALDRFDALSFMMHEFGHALGMNFAFGSPAYDMLPSTMGNRQVGAVEGPGYELVLESALMNDSIALTKGKRTFASATDILATADQGGFSYFNLPRIDLLGENSDNWNDTLNWIGGKVPTSVNDVFARSGNYVRLYDGLAQAKSLFIGDNSQALTAGSSRLEVKQKLQIGSSSLFGTGSRGELHIGTLTGVPQLDVGNMNIENGIVNLQSQGASLVSRGRLDIGSEGVLMGGGRVEVGGELNNDGEISAGMFLLFGFGGDLYLRAYDYGRLDLDGGDEYFGNIETGTISAVNGNLFILSPLADSFDGLAVVKGGRTMYFATPWSNTGNLELRGGYTTDKAAVLGGSEFIHHGAAEVTGLAMINAPMVVGPAGSFRLRSGSQLYLAGHHTGPQDNLLSYRGTFDLDYNSMLSVDLTGGDRWTLTGKMTMAPFTTVVGDDIVNQGRIEGSGNLGVNNVWNAGVIAPVGPMEIRNGSLTQESVGKVAIDIAGLTQGFNYDVLRVGGNASLAGILEISLADGFLPAVGSLFDVLSAQNIVGNFSQLSILASSDVEFGGQLQYSAGKVTFAVTQSNFTGDFDADGDVDGGDFAAWARASAFGTPGLNGEGDADHDNDVDGADFLIVQRQLGRVANRFPALPEGFAGLQGGGAPGVPEPSSAMLALGGLGAVLVARLRTRPAGQSGK